MSPPLGEHAAVPPAPAPGSGPAGPTSPIDAAVGGIRSAAEVLKRTLQLVDEHNLLFLGSALTFDALLAALPLLLLLLVGLTHVAQLAFQSTDVDVNRMFERFLPPHSLVEGKDPFAPVEQFLASVTKNRAQLSLYAVPLFLWFSTRLFASVRISLNQIFAVGARPSHRHFLMHFFRSKVRDFGMVIITVLLFAANTVISAVLAVLRVRAASVSTVPVLHFFVTSLGRFVTELLAFGFAVTLFFLLYKYASRRRLPWRTSLLAATFTGVAFELAKRLYGLYLRYLAGMQTYSGNATLGAFILFVVWLYYMSVVFLFGGVVAEIWEGRGRPMELRQGERRRKS